MYATPNVVHAWSIMCLSYIVATSSPTYAEIVFPAELVDERLQSALIQLRDPSAGIPGVVIPDPMPLQDIETNVTQGPIKVSAQLWNSSIAGLSTFHLAQVHTNLVNLELGLQLNVSELLANGNYSLAGTIAFMPIKGNGHFWMKMLNATLLGKTNLTVTDNGRLQVSNVQLDIKVQRIQLHFENLLGKGFIARFSNSLLNALSKIIFENIKPFILTKMQALVRDTMNAQFAELPPEPRLLSALSPLDLAIKQATEEMKRLKLDPYPLPTHSRSFEQKILFFTAHGKVALYGGFIHGISTLHRTESIDFMFSNNTLQLTANLGFDEIGGGYKWLLNFMGIEKVGGIHFRIDSVDMRIVIALENQKGSIPQVKVLEIKDIYQLRPDIDGAGSADLILEFVGNFIANIFKSQLTEIVEGPMKQIIQKNLNSIKLPF